MPDGYHYTTVLSTEHTVIVENYKNVLLNDALIQRNLVVARGNTLVS